MDIAILPMALGALANLMEPGRMLALASGVLLGLFIGIIPGIGGLAGMALLLPIAMELEPYSAFAFLIGMAAVTTTSDTLPAVLFGVPGTVGSAATVLDGYPMARRGEAGRALGAAYAASLLGGIFGALLLALCIPVARPMVLALGSPELFAISIVGLSMVAALSGDAPLKGLTAACVGLLLSMVGAGPATGELRWTFETLYLWDGLPLIPVTLGLFAIPEIADMAIRRVGMQAPRSLNVRAGQMAGIRDVFRSWWLVVRCSWIGAALGAIPGIGVAVIDWMAYAHAKNTERNSEGFGEGDVRGVIASESANNAKEGGALVPTIVFGVPGSATMAILLGAFMMHGLVPGPDMLESKLDVTYTIVWSIALANIMGAGICLAFSNHLAKVAEVRIGILVPLIMAVIAVAAYQGSRHLGDLYVALGAGLLGWFMKRQGWPRAPLILGFVLGGLIENYLFISIARYEWAWLSRPLVILLLGIAVLTVARPAIRGIWQAFSTENRWHPARPRLSARTIIPAVLTAIFVPALIGSADWRFNTRIGPQVILLVAMACTAGVLIGEIFFPCGGPRENRLGGSTNSADTRVPPSAVTRRRAILFFAMWVGLFGLVQFIGMMPAIFVFVGLSARFFGGERMVTSFALAFGMTTFTWAVFEKFLAIPWPMPLVAEWFPTLRHIVQ